MYRLYWKMTIYGHFQYNLYIFGIHLWTVLYPKPCYNKLCYKEVVVYVGFFPIYVLCLSEIRTQMMMMIWCFMSLSTSFKSYRLKGDNKRLRTIKCCTAGLKSASSRIKTWDLMIWGQEHYHLLPSPPTPSLLPTLQTLQDTNINKYYKPSKR